MHTHIEHTLTYTMHALTYFTHTHTHIHTPFFQSYTNSYSVTCNSNEILIPKLSTQFVFRIISNWTLQLRKGVCHIKRINYWAELSNVGKYNCASSHAHSTNLLHGKTEKCNSVKSLKYVENEEKVEERSWTLKRRRILSGTTGT